MDHLRRGLVEVDKMIWAMSMLILVVVMTLVIGRKKDDYLSVVMVLSAGIMVMIYTSSLPIWTVFIPIAIIAFMIIRGD